MRVFLLVKTSPGKEKDVLKRFEAMDEVREIHLITGKFDLLVAMESPEEELDPRRKVVEVVVEKVRKLGGIVDTRTIMPIESQTRTMPPSDKPRVRGFVFMQCELGKEKELMSKLLRLPEVAAVHLLFGKADLLTELDVEKSFVHPPPQHIATIVEAGISKLGGILDTDTYVPLESIVK